MDTPPPVNPEPTPPLPPTLLPPSSPEEKQWTVILHLSALLGIFTPAVLNVVAPLVVWLIKKPEIPALEEEGKKVLNFQISFSIYMIAAGLIFAVTSCLFFTIILPIAVWIAWLVITIIGGIKASNGEPYVFPMTLKLL